MMQLLLNAENDRRIGSARTPSETEKLIAMNLAIVKLKISVM
jgi:hypothetical protein